MSKTCKLVMITGDNNNKYYDLVEEGGCINVTYGRIGSTAMSATYSSCKWDSLIKSKQKKVTRM